MTSHRSSHLIGTPVQDYRDMLGWPGTLPKDRMETLLTALETRRDPQGDQIIEDLEMLIKAQQSIQYSAQIPPELTTPPQIGLDGPALSFYELERMTTAAWMQDTVSSIGGLISTAVNGGSQEQRIMFKLLRHPHWIGFNTVLPFLDGLNAVVSESREMPGRPGIVTAEPSQDGFPPGTLADFPDGEAKMLAEVLAFHRPAAVRWSPQSAEAERIDWYRR